jgi:hypothetical protein
MSSPEPSDVGSLLQALEGHIGVVEGTGEAFSQDCGKRFAEGLAADLGRLSHDIDWYGAEGRTSRRPG